MKLRKFHLLCYVCVLYTFVQSKKTNWENQSTPNPSSSSQEPTELLNANNPRDKRALGLILSGLAQVFGYTVSPVQIASLPNPNSESDEARATNNTQTNSTQSTTLAPRQRETIKFTGVVNFSNGTGILTQLQQYENIFHGNSSSTTSKPPSTSSAMPPQIDPRKQTPNQPLPPPLLVKIPLPVISEPSLPTVPQPPLPEIPSQFINLSYPEPYISSIRNEQGMVYRKNVSTEKVTIENQPIYNAKDIQSPPPPMLVQPPMIHDLSTTSPSYNEDPRWKQEYEERLAELERKQEEHAKRLREQEWYRNRQKDDNYSGEEDGDSRKQIDHGDQDSGCGGNQEESDKGKPLREEEDQSRERYESEERIREYPTNQKQPAESEEEYYRNDDVYKEDTPQTSENYTSIQYSEPLPLSEDDEERRPEDLRNSYGEPLYNRELIDDGFVNFFGRLKQPLSNIYSSSVPAESEEEVSREEEDSRGNQKDENESDERSREEDVPARNKYEEYTLEEDTNNRKKDGKGSNEDNSELPMKISNNQSNGENRSFSTEERNVADELDFSKFMPLIVPVRYLNAPEELRKMKLKSSTNEKSENDNTLRAEASKKVSSKEPKRSKKENLKPVVGVAERKTPKNLHEGEQKEVQMWPPPFDFIFDSTIHTNIVPRNSNDNDNIKVSNSQENRRKFESSNKMRKEKHGEEKSQIILDNSNQRPYGYSENIYDQGLKKELEFRTVPGKRLMMNRPINTVSSNKTRFETKTVKSNQNDDDRKEIPDFLKRYKYISNNNYRSTERPNIEIKNFPELQDPSSLNSMKLESSKRSIARNQPSSKNKKQINVKNRIMQDTPVPRQKFESTMFLEPRENYNLFNFGERVYDFNYGRGNDRLSGVFDGNKKIRNVEIIGLTTPQQDVYRYDESLTKFTSEPESRSEKVEDYANGATTIKMVAQERINPNEPISYVDYSRIL